MKTLALLLTILIILPAVAFISHSHAGSPEITEKTIFSKSGNDRIEIDGSFTDWRSEDVKATDNFGDEYVFSDGLDDSRDILAFYFYRGNSSLYFRLDFLDLLIGAENGGLDFYIAINYSSGGQDWLPDYVETRTDTPWEVCIAIYDTEHYAVYLQNWSFANWSVEGIKYYAQWDSVEIALNSSLLIENGWDFSLLSFQVYTTRDGTDGGAGEISYGGGNNTPESDIVDAIGSQLYRGDSSHNGWLNGSIPENSHIIPTKIAFLHHANQFLKNISYFVGNGEIGMYAVPKIHEYWKVPVNLHISGTLADGIEYYRPDFNRYIRKLADEGIAHMVGGFYAEYIPKYLPREFNNWSMEYAKEYNERYYNYTPEVCWIPERVFWHGWEETVKDGSYEIVVADTEVAFNWYHPSWAREGEDEYYVWNDSGIKVLFISNTGRAGNWQNIQDMLPNPTDGGLNINIRKLLVRNEMEDPANRYVLYMDDWEKFFGNAPHWGGPEVIIAYNESIGWIAQHQWIEVTSLEDLAKLPVHGDIKINDASYFWLTQNLGTAGSDSTGPNDDYDLYDAWYYDPYHEITEGVSYFNYTPEDNIEKLGDYRTEGTVIHDVWNSIRDIPEDSPLHDLAFRTFAAMMYETAWRGAGISITMHEDISDWEKDQASHIKDAILFHHAYLWLQNGTRGVWMQDVDMDGSKEAVIATDSLYAIVDSRGGKITFAMDSSGRVLINNAYAGWHVRGDSVTDIVSISTTNYHYSRDPVPYNQGSKSFAFEDLGYENEMYNLTVVDGNVIAENDGILKVYTPFRDGLMVNYTTARVQGIRITLSPDLENLTTLEIAEYGDVRGVVNPGSGIGVYVVPENATFYLVRGVTMGAYLVYYGRGSFSFVLRSCAGEYENMAPWVTGGIPDVEVPEDGKAVNVLNLSEYFLDDSPENLTFSLNYDLSPGVYVLLNGTCVSVDASTGERNDNWNGWIRVEVVASDPEGLNATSYFMVHVYPVNDPPQIILNVKDNFTLYGEKILVVETKDVDGDDVVISYSLDGGKFVEGRTIKLDANALKEGKHTLVIRASDGNSTTYRNLTFEVVHERKYPLEAAIASVTLFAVLIVAAVRRKSED